MGVIQNPKDQNPSTTSPQSVGGVKKGDRVERDRFVVRFHTTSEDGFRSDSVKSLPSAALMLTSKDKEGDPPHLSVWDEKMTILDQVRGRLDGKKAYDAFKVQAGRINDCKALPDPDYEVTVIRTPLNDDKPCASGHCGIIGFPLKGKKGETKNTLKIWRRELEAELANLFTWVEHFPSIS